MVGDLVRVRTIDASMNWVRRVDSRGMLAVPRVGDVAVLGASKDEAERRIRRALLSADREPPVDFAIALEADRHTPIHVRGAVRADGTLPWRAGVTSAEVLAVVGLREDADPAEATIEGLDAEPVKATTRSLRPGDILRVPTRLRSPEILVLGGVVQPGAQPWKEGMTIRQAIETAGGLSDKGDAAKVEWRSGAQSTPGTLEALQGRALREGDRVVVGLAESQFVTISGAVRQPGLIPFEDDLSLLDALELAGGMLRGRRTLVTIVSKNGTKTKFDLEEVRRQRRPDPILAPFDRIEIEVFVHPASGDSKGGG